MLSMITLQGISVSPGIANAQVFVIPDQEENTINTSSIAPSQIEQQWTDFLQAVEQVKNDIQTLNNPNNAEQCQIFESYSLMLNDTVFIDQIKKKHSSSLLHIENVVFTEYKTMADTLRLSGDDYLSQRADDICDVFGRVIAVLQGNKRFDFETIPQNCVIVAKNILPTDAFILDKKKPAALLLQEGSNRGHLAILTRNYGVPAVFGIGRLCSSIKNGMNVIVDAAQASVYIEPDEQTVEIYKDKMQSQQQYNSELASFIEKHAKTKDGTKFGIYANISTVEEAQTAADQGAAGIGLFRTEFLFISEDRLLSEDEQFEAYKKVLQIMQGKPVVIRTLDSGADKHTAADSITSADEKNPLLGLRAIRLCLSNVELFKIQLRALYRASVFGNLKIEFPLICCKEELDKALDIAKQVRAELKSQKIPFNANVPLGIMVETASAALSADFLAKYADFFSIGTNDLVQYSLGIDRDNPGVAPLFDEFNPSILRMISFVSESAKKAKIDLSVCGEMASSPEGIIILAGLGIRDFSMGAKNISKAKRLLSRFTLKELEKAAKDVQFFEQGSKIKENLRLLLPNNLYSR